MISCTSPDLPAALCAETDGNADDTGAGEYGRDRNAELAQEQHAGDNGDDDRGQVTEDAAHGLDALQLLELVVHAVEHEAAHEDDGLGRQLERQPRQQQDDDDMQRGPVEEA